MGSPVWIEEWEGVAREILDATATTTPVCAFALAKACELEVRPGDVAEAKLDGNVILYNPKMRLVRQHMRISHEIGHFGLERHGLPDSEDGARHIGGAMLAPWREMRRDLVETAWSIPKLRERHVNVSATALAIRITQLRDAVVALIDPRDRKRAWRRPSPWITDPRLSGRPSKFERELARAAWEAGEEVRGDELCYAVPLFDETGAGEDRVIVVCELEQLSLRLA